MALDIEKEYDRDSVIHFLHELFEEYDNLKDQNTELENKLFDKNEEIKNLQIEVYDLQNQVRKLEAQVDDLQY